MMRRVLITGGSGFIGKNLKKYLQGNGFLVKSPSSQEFDVLKEHDGREWKKEGIDHVVHLAGKTYVPDSWREPEKFLAVNVLGTLRMIGLCRELGIGMTYVSAYIYGQPERIPIEECAEARPNNPYAQSKYMAEELCRFFCDYYEMDISVLRLFNVYGPGQGEKFLIPFITKQALGNEEAITLQDLTPKRDYVYIDDICRAIETSIHKTSRYHLFNVGSGVSYSVSDVVNIIQKVAGTEKPVVSRDNSRRNEINDVVADISRIRKEWGWEPTMPLESGLRKCMEGIK